jgi:O-antigen/teichoic acid export membrane protein
LKVRESKIYTLSTIKRNFIYNALLSLSHVIFPLITFPYVARIILPTGIGEVVFIESICKYVILFSALGIPIYGVREIAKVKTDQIKLNRLFTELVLLNGMLTVVVLGLFIVSFLCIDVFSSDINFYILGCFLILSNVFTIEWYFQGIEQFKFITLRNLLVKTILTFLIFTLVKERSDVLIYFTIIVLGSVLNAIINFKYALKIVRLDFKLDFKGLKRHVKPLFFIFSSIAFISIYTLLDTIMLGFMTNAETVGLYSAGLKVSRIPIMFVGALGLVLLPKLSEQFHNGEMEEFKLMIQKSLQFVFTFSIPVIFFLLSLSHEAIVIFAGNNFIKSGSVLMILSALSLLIGLSNIFGLQILTPMGKDKFLSYSVLLGVVVSVGLNLLLVPKYQENGAAWSNLIAEITVTAATFYFANKSIKISFDWVFIFKNIVFALPLFLIPNVVSQLHMDTITGLVISIVISVVYFILIQLYVIKNTLIRNLKNSVLH